MVADLEGDVSQARAEQLARRALARAQATPASPPRWAVVVAGASFVTVVSTGLGLAADGAVPGDALYRVDRGFELIADSVGGDRDRSVERLEEVIALADRGDVDGASSTALEALRSIGRSTRTEPDPVVPGGDPTTTLAIPAAPPAPEQAVTIRLAAEKLLRSVREAPADVEAAAAELALAAGVVGEPSTTNPEEPGGTLSTEAPAPPSSSTTSTIPTGSTTTTVGPADGGSSSGGSADGGSSSAGNTDTTSTTAPKEGPGPIILPPLP